MNRYTVLVVGAEPGAAEDLKRRLQNVGHEVVGCVRTGTEAVDAVRRLVPAVVVMEPGLLGFPDDIEVVQSIRAAAPVALVYITADGDAGTLTRVKATAPEGHLLKPVGERELKIEIELAVHRCEVAQEQAQPEERQLQEPGTVPLPKTSKWRYEAHRADLTAPNGTRIPLTAYESILLDTLLKRPGENVPHPALLRALEYPNDRYGQQRLEALISRLRRKLRTAHPNGELPLRSRRSLGYVFLVDDEDEEA